MKHLLMLVTVAPALMLAAKPVQAPQESARTFVTLFVMSCQAVTFEAPEPRVDRGPPPLDDQFGKLPRYVEGDKYRTALITGIVRDSAMAFDPDFIRLAKERNAYDYWIKDPVARLPAHKTSFSGVTVRWLATECADMLAKERTFMLAPQTFPSALTGSAIAPFPTLLPVGAMPSNAVRR